MNAARQYQSRGGTCAQNQDMAEWLRDGTPIADTDLSGTVQESDVGGGLAVRVDLIVKGGFSIRGEAMKRGLWW